MSHIVIQGGRRLEGTLTVQGAKNSVLPILAATILHPGRTTLRGCPRLSDVEASIRILRHLGCKAEWEGEELTVDASTLDRWDIPDHLMREMRSSVVFLGAILARMGWAELSHPGGCELGPRPIDLHLAALRQLGAQLREESGCLQCSAQCMEGREIVLSMPSVGATENAMLAACGAEGETVLVNAAREPEIGDLQSFLNSLGACVRGAGSSTITVEGGRALSGGEYTVMGDRIVAATLLSAAAAAGGRVRLGGVDWRHLATVLSVFHQAGCRVESKLEYVELERDRDTPLKGVPTIRTAPYPGFPTDAQAPVMAALAASQGCTLFVETMFDSRYRHVPELIRMGADITTEGRVALVRGVERLRGARVEASDLRGGGALAVAALGAEGATVLSGLRHIDRGYEGLEGMLQALGARVERREE